MTAASCKKSVCITGASRGLGLATAEAFRAGGWHVALVARDASALELAASRLLGMPCDADVFPIPLDLMKQEAGEKLFNMLKGRWGGLDALVNNAGIQGPIGPLWTSSPEEWERTFRLLLFTPASLCRFAIPWMRKRGGGTIVNISGGGATGPRPNFSAYGAAKAALVRLTETLAMECVPHGIAVNAVAPGAMPTAMLHEVTEAGEGSAGQKEYETALRLTTTSDAAVIRRAAQCVFTLAQPGVPVTGKLISAVWDPWEKLSEHVEDLGSDIYTLRRITPKDRGKTWGNDL